METSLAALFTPFTVGPLHLPNRIVMAPMTRNFSPGGVPGPDVAAYYARRARHGVGLIITEGTTIDHPVASSSPTVPRFHGADALAGWARVVDEVHREGGRILAQLWHVGIDPQAPPPYPQAPPVGPSGMIAPGMTVTRPMSPADIAEVVDAFARAAAEARRLGFDGLELHGAHGYLIDQFLWAGTNRRADGYGGSPGARARFAAEVVAACRAAVGPDFPILLRISQWKVADFHARLADDPDELAELLAPLVDAGVDVFDCSTRRFWLPAFEGSPLGLAGWVKRLTGRPTIAVGSVGLDNSEFLDSLMTGKGAANARLDEVVDRLAAGEFDLVALGRLLLSDPRWVEKIRDGRFTELAPFSADALAVLS
ncbi:NADH:flavin oxidoreductase [Plantactinospora sp. KBS50]|uniref:NADH:flavin oxidoreductase n=1 Tax=Plantactinospora sp. KBS50 TaxID=2024580 RepID=UPI001E545980|nr:NADH:flavin oxidoreductase [Plantactinospora sp. KBS50]